MKFYISAKWQLWDKVAEMQDLLRSMGHNIAADWTVRANARDYEEIPEQSQRFADEEVKAILESDIFIHLSDLRGGKGKYVDLGIALAGYNLQQKPSGIYVVGSKANESQFYFSTGIERVVCEDPVHSINHIIYCPRR